MEENIEYWHAEKLDKYQKEFSHVCDWKIIFVMLEVGCRGWVPPRFSTLMRKLGFTSREIRNSISNVQLLVRKCSYTIWINRYNKDFSPIRITIDGDMPSLQHLNSNQNNLDNCQNGQLALTDEQQKRATRNQKIAQQRLLQKSLIAKEAVLPSSLTSRSSSLTDEERKRSSSLTDEECKRATANREVALSRLKQKSTAPRSSSLTDEQCKRATANRNIALSRLKQKPTASRLIISMTNSNVDTKANTGNWKLLDQPGLILYNTRNSCWFHAGLQFLSASSIFLLRSIDNKHMSELSTKFKEAMEAIIYHGQLTPIQQLFNLVSINN
jgi:hypothetical protein